MEIDSPTPSLLERMGDSRRTSGGRSSGARRTASAPYVGVYLPSSTLLNSTQFLQQKKRDALGSSNADADDIWKHDRHDGGGSGGSLAARLHGKESRPRPDVSIVQSVLRGVTTDGRGLTIKGAGQPNQPIIEVTGLVAGTTPEDVKVCSLASFSWQQLLIPGQGDLPKLRTHFESPFIELLNRSISSCRLTL